MEINITPATPAQDQSADIAFPSTTSFTLTPLSPKQHDDPPPPTAKSSSSSTSTTKPITPITISATLSDIAAAIDNVRGLFFQIQEQRHLQSFSTVTTTSSNHQHQDNGRLSPPASATTSSSRTGGPPPTQTSELDKSLIQLDSQLEQVSQSMLIAESQVDTLLKSSSADQDDDGQQQPDYLRNLTRTRRDSRTSLSSLASFDDALLQTGSSTHASYAPALTPAQVQSRFQDLQQDWASVTTDADMLKRELSEDKYLLVFRSVSDQADNMMASLHKAITLSQEFINAFRTSQQYLQSQQTQMGTSGSRLSLDGNDQLSPESQLEELRALKKTFNVKTSYYGPACEQVFHVLERGIKDKATSNGTILHRYADLKMRWKTTREGILRTDRDLTKIERHLCKCLGVGGADLPPYSAEVQQHFGGAGVGVGVGVSSPARGRQDSAASAASTPPRLQPKSSQRTLRHMHSSGTSASQSIGDGSFTLASPSSTRSGDVGLSPPAPAKPPRSELRRAPSSSRLASSSTNGGAGAIPIPGRNPVASNNNNRPSQQQQVLSSSMGNNGRTGMPHRRSISASVNEPMSDVSYRRASILSTSQQQQQQHSTDRPPIPPRGGSRAGARTPLGTSSSGAIHNPFKHTGSEYSYSALTSGRNLGGSGTGVGVSPRRAHSPTHPPSSYRLPGGQAQAQAQAQVVPRRSKTPQPLGQGQGGGRYAERGSSEPPESSFGVARPGSRASASGRIGGTGTGTIRAAPGGRGRADSRAFDDAMEDLSVESFDGITRSVAAASAAPSATGGRGMRQRPASSMAGYYYHPPSAHGQQPTDSHIPRLAVDASSQSGNSGNGNGRSPATSLSSLPARPGSSMSQTSSSTTGFASRARMGSSGFPSRGGAGPSRMSMQTPEPVLAAQVKRLSMFARPSSMSQQQQHNQSTSLLQQQQQQQANAYGGSGVAAAVRKSSRPPPARLNNPSRTGRTTPLSAAALAAVPQANPALAWMRDVSSTGGGGGGGGVGGPNGGTSPSQSSSSVAAYRAQRAAAASSSASAANSSFNNNGGTNARAETPLSESSFGGQSVGGWGVRPSAANARAAAGMMSSATGGARGGAGSFDVYIPNARDALDVAVAEVVNALGVAIERVDESLPRGVRSEVAPGKELQARYSIAGKTVACKLLMLHRPAGAAGTRTNVKKLLVRVGGGWQDFEGWISSSILGHLDY